MHIGIDFGSKLSGNTVVCAQINDQLHLFSLLKGKDTDKWLSELMLDLKPEKVFIDAPLTLPLAYYGLGNDFFFRLCDKECHAMSPMFLGGLTARAMSFANQFCHIPFFEAYPKQVVHLLGLNEFYKSSIPELLCLLQQILPVAVADQVVTWHQVDAILAWLVGFRYIQGQAKVYGNPNEGLILA